MSMSSGTGASAPSPSTKQSSVPGTSDAGPSALHTFVRGLDRLAWRLNWWNERLCAVLAAVMVGIVGFGVVERYLLHLGHTWTEEMARYVMIWMALLAVPVCAYRREHIGLDLVFSRLPELVRRWLRVTLDCIAIGFFLLLTGYGIVMVEGGATQYATIFGITMLVPFLSVPVTSALTVFQILVTMLREYCGLTPEFIIREGEDAICSQ